MNWLTSGEQVQQFDPLGIGCDFWYTKVQSQFLDVTSNGLGNPYDVSTAQNNVQVHCLIFLNGHFHFKGASRFNSSLLQQIRKHLTAQ
jgi:hypothetical protein